MLVTYRRHNPKKCQLTSRMDHRCKCPIWVSGTLETGVRLRRTLKFRDWNRAQEMVRKWETRGVEPRKNLITLEMWRDQFMKDAEARNLSDGTCRLHRLLFRQLEEFMTDKGLVSISDLDVTMLSEFRNGWKIGALTASKKLERLRSVMKFAVERKLLADNPAKLLRAPQVKSIPTLPFTDDEMERIEAAASDPHVKALILLIRWSGLRMSDATTLSINRLKADKLVLYQAKTGHNVSVLLPAKVAASLRALPRKGEYLFWTGESKVETVTGFWREKIADVFKAAGIKGHPHRFRDTFAVALLNAGVSLEHVSILLGHKKIWITEKHYAPWVKSRQDVLDKAVRAALPL
jgi:integrase/recombinase XerD